MYRGLKMNRIVLKKDIHDIIGNIYSKYKCVKEVNFSNDIDREKSDVFEIVDAELRFIISKEQKLRISDIDTIGFGDIYQEENSLICIPKAYPQHGLNNKICSVLLNEDFVKKYKYIYIDAEFDKDTHFQFILHDLKSFEMTRRFHKDKSALNNEFVKEKHTVKNKKVHFCFEYPHYLFYIKDREVIEETTHINYIDKEKLKDEIVSARILFDLKDKSIILNDLTKLKLKNIDFVNDDIKYIQIAVGNKNVKIKQITLGDRRGSIFLKSSIFEENYNKLIIISNRENLVIEKDKLDKMKNKSGIAIELDGNNILKKIFLEKE
ncbi:hypothetical protein SDC9_113099 [bioreactor metagenome]|uniref:Uncharacterized protein n=1 Tax=bioreactor metagenome TaxID=1076179 RepID=A0A645BLY8_9ZZZZ